MLLPSLSSGISRLCFIGCLLALAGGTLRAQAPAWDGVVGRLSSQAGSVGTINAAAADARGNIVVAGSFVGTLVLGNTTLTSADSGDLFVAKYVPATDTWAWVRRGGGTGNDYCTGLAVSGSSVFVVGGIFNNTANANAVVLEGAATGTGQLNGATATASTDLLLAKYLDNGSSATLAWTQVGGGTGLDEANGVAVNGSNVYVTGYLNNTSANLAGVLLGGSGTTAGTVQVNGATAGTTTSADLLLAKYTDNGSSATLGWTQVGGGTRADIGYAVAVRGSSVYVAGLLANSTTNANAVLFGNSGTTAGTVQVNGATSTASQDVLLVKYQDNGTTGSYVWSQVGGGTDNDYAQGLAVSGASIYVAGYLTNNAANTNAAVFGGGGTASTTPQAGASGTTSQDLLLAKYTDNGLTATLGWTQVGGGIASDASPALAVSGASIYLSGYLVNNTANANNALFGGSGTSLGTSAVAGASPSISPDVVLAKYLDNGGSATLAWAQVGGGQGYDAARAVVVSGQQVYVAGFATSPATFGPTILTSPATGTVHLLARLTDPTLQPLPTRAASVAALTCHPNPALAGAALLTGAAPGQAVQVLDALGRVVATATVDANGTAALGGLAPGLHLVRAGAATVRLAVE